MNKEGKMMEIRQRRDSLGNLIAQAGRLYGTREQNAKVSREEFVELIKFTYEVPLIVLDFVDAVTGSELLKDLKNFEFPFKVTQYFNCDSPRYNGLKS